MRKYFLADLLTLSEVILTCILLIMTVCDAPADVAIWIFIAAELCDAFDGICARRWHYPKDGKRRIWREYASEIDQISDLFLIIVSGLYVIVRINSRAGWMIGLIVAGFSVIVQILTHDQAKLNAEVLEVLLPIAERRYERRVRRFTTRVAERKKVGSMPQFPPIRQVNFAECLILLRRYVYVSVIGAIIVMLIFATSWGHGTKQIVLGIGIAVGLALVIVKRNRLTQDKTPL